MIDQALLSLFRYVGVDYRLAILISIMSLLFPPSVLGGQAGFDAVCAKYVTARGFKSGTTVQWESRVLPEFERVLGSRQLEDEALLNVKFKALLAVHGISESEAPLHTSSWIISECAKNQERDGCFAMQAYCVRDFVTKELPAAARSTLLCVESWNRPFCGKNFQTPSGVEKEIAKLEKVEHSVSRLMETARARPHVPDYLDDLDGTFTDFSAKVRVLAASSGKSIESARKDQLARTHQRHEAELKKKTGLREACEAFADCRTHLKKKGYTDSSGILPQISSCRLNSQKPNPLVPHEFTLAMQALDQVEAKENQTRLAALTRKAFHATRVKTAEDYIRGFYSLTGFMPKYSVFCERAGQCEDLELKKVYGRMEKKMAVEKPRFDLDAHIRLFNEKVSALNSACSRARGGDLAAAEKAYQDVLYRTPLGSLLALESFSKTVGGFNQDACVILGKGLKPIEPGGRKTIERALHEALGLHVIKIQELNGEKAKLLDPRDPSAGIRHFLEREPLILRELLRSEKDPTMAILLCREIEAIYRDDKKRQIISGLLKGASAGAALVAAVLAAPAVLGAVGIAAAGAGTSLIISAASATAVSTGIIASYRGWSNARETRRVTRIAAVTGGTNLELANELIRESRIEGRASVVAAALNFTPTGPFWVTGQVLNLDFVKATLHKPALKAVQKGKTIANLALHDPEPVKMFESKIGSGAPVSPSDVQMALASRVRLGTTESQVEAFNAIAADMGDQSALLFATLAIKHSNPYSDQGTHEILKAIAQTQGPESVGPAGMRYLEARRTVVKQR